MIKDLTGSRPMGSHMARRRPRWAVAAHFSGTAAAAAAGVVGGSLLLNSIRSMMGGSRYGFGDSGATAEKATGQSPWTDQSGSSLAPKPGSATSAHPPIAPMTVRAQDFLTPPLATMVTTRILTRMTSAVTETATSPDRVGLARWTTAARNGRPFFIFLQAVDQMTTTLVPTLTRP